MLSLGCIVCVLIVHHVCVIVAGLMCIWDGLAWLLARHDVLVRHDQGRHGMFKVEIMEMKNIEALRGLYEGSRMMKAKEFIRV